MKRIVKSSRPWLRVLMVMVLAVAIAMPTAVSAFAKEYYNDFLATPGSTYDSDYSSIEQVQMASAEVCNQIVDEGTVLLKNDGSLPLTEKGLKVSVFGSHTGGMNGITSGFQKLGFEVNKNANIAASGKTADDSNTLPKNYSAETREKNEVTYNDAAIIVFGDSFGSVSGENSGYGFIANGPVRGTTSSKGKTSAAEGEGTANDITDPGNASVEDFKDADGNNYVLPSGKTFRQKNFAYTVWDKEEERYVTIYEEFDAENTERYEIVYYKHPLMLSEEAEQLISYTTDNFEVVIIIFMSANQLEVGILEADPGVSAIMWSGHRDQKTSPKGCDNMLEMAKIITGEVNPSGKTINTWAWDFSNSTTWMNDGNSGMTFASINGKDASEWEAERIFHGSSFAMGLRDENGRYYIRAKRVGNNKRNYALPVMYEEDIYMGYRYYETAAVEAEAGNYEGYLYNDEVVYPFGHGLSYTTFTKEIVAADTSAWDSLVKQAQAGKVSGIKDDATIALAVKVTNTGSRAGKDVVEVYGHAPYFTGKVAKSEVNLIGFEKTKELQPGESQIVKVTVKVRDLASYDWSDANDNGFTTYELDANAGSTAEDGNGSRDYEIRVQSDSHNCDDVLTLGKLANDVIINIAYKTGTEIDNVFDEGSLEDSLSYDPATKKNMVEEGKMTLLSRADFAGTWPEMSTPKQMVRSDLYFELLDASNDFKAETFYTSNELLVEQTTNGYDNSGANTYDSSTSSHDTPVLSPYYDLYVGVAGAAKETTEDNSDFPWAVTKEEFIEKTGGNWAQMEDSNAQAIAKALAGDSWILFYEMKGIDPLSDEVIHGGKLDGMTGKEAWVAFMNQLTLEEMKTIILYGGFNTTTIESIERPNSRHCDDMMGLSRQGVHTSLRIQFGDSPVNAATWNKELQYERGKLVAECGLWSGVVGWYGVGGDLHRSAYGGRNPEYYGEDPYLIGHISGSHGAGAESKGLITYVKHNAMNESETGRYNRHTYATEQACREIYFKGFEICLEDYELRGTMTSYNNIGDRQAATNSAYQWNIVREEWGFMGLSLTDAVTPKEISYTADMMVRAGGSQVLADIHNSSGQAGFYDRLGGTYVAAENKVVVDKYVDSYVEGEYTRTKDGVVDSYTQWYYVRMGALHTLYAEANTATADRAYYGLYVGEGSEGTGNPYETDETPRINLNDKYSFTVKVGQSLPDGIYAAPPTLPHASASSKEYTYVIGETSSGRTTPLPDGITMDPQTGKLSGTPTKAGTTQFAVWGGNLQGGWVRNVQFFTITVEAADAAPATEWEENVPYIGENGNWFVNGKDLGVKAAGEDGQDGIDGIDGQDGRDGIDGQDGKDGVGVDKITTKAIADGTEYTITFTDDREPVIVTIKAGDAIVSSGCGGFIGIGAGALAIITMIGAAIVIRKKED